MHIVLAWNIGASGSRYQEIESSLRAVIKPYSWVEALQSFYIIKIRDADEIKNIKENLSEVVKRTDERVHYIISPAMTGGRYDGWLSKKTWPKINERTD